MTTSVEIRPRLRLPREVAEKLEGLTVDEKSARVIQALAEPTLDRLMATWCPEALRDIAGVLEAAAEEHLRWVSDVEMPGCLYQPHILAGWAALLRETASKGIA